MKTRQGSNARKAIQIVLATGVALGAAQAQAASDIFLTITGLPGESVDSKHKDAIDVTAYTQAVDNRECRITVAKGIDRASPGLVGAASTKGNYGSATLVVRKAGKDQVEYLTITMQNVVVGNVDQNVNRDQVPTEEVVLLPKFMTISYKPQNPDGSPGAAVESTPNCK